MVLTVTMPDRDVPPLPPGLRSTARRRVANELNTTAIHALRRARVSDLDSGLSPERLSVLSVLVYAGPRTMGDLARAEQVTRPGHHPHRRRAGERRPGEPRAGGDRPTRGPGPCDPGRPGRPRGRPPSPGRDPRRRARGHERRGAGAGEPGPRGRPPGPRRPTTDGWAGAARPSHFVDSTTVVRVRATPRIRRSRDRVRSRPDTSGTRTLIRKLSSPATNQQSSTSSSR